MEDFQFLSMINLIAVEYNMKLEIDFDTHIINFIGEYNTEVELKCAERIAEILGEYT